ncbi:MULTISPECIES: hypothetical protein [Sphingobacterium]|uniref:Lipoprotein n=1 Tax=Sphingobacterium populi TaxID=1812824 RepID=A0ABW5U9C6_9SPHI|nr:hypothetical protein [Sphingobacterium sp. CFCC 11742]
MKFNLFLSFTTLVITLLTSCNRPSADEFFQTTVLNTNILNEFASERFAKSLIAETVEFPDIPSTKNNGDEAQQIVDNKIAYIEQTIKKIEDSTAPDEDGKIIKEKALDLFKFVLPVYQKEYKNLAIMCDQKQAENEIMAESEKIIETYGSAYEEKYVTLLTLGQDYAEKHHLNVSFGN